MLVRVLFGLVVLVVLVVPSVRCHSVLNVDPKLLCLSVHVLSLSVSRSASVVPVVFLAFVHLLLVLVAPSCLLPLVSVLLSCLLVPLRPVLSGVWALLSLSVLSPSYRMSALHRLHLLVVVFVLVHRLVLAHCLHRRRLGHDRLLRLDLGLCRGP